MYLTTGWVAIWNLWVLFWLRKLRYLWDQISASYLQNSFEHLNLKIWHKNVQKYSHSYDSYNFRSKLLLFSSSPKHVLFDFCSVSRLFTNYETRELNHLLSVSRLPPSIRQIKHSSSHDKSEASNRCSGSSKRVQLRGAATNVLNLVPPLKGIYQQISR